MEKVYDMHCHYIFYIPIKETIEIFKEEFELTGTEKCAFLSLPHHANGYGLYLTADQNIKGLFLKHAFAPNAYAFAGLIHPQEKMTDEEQAKLYRNQAEKYFSAGYDGIKMFEGHPTIRRATKIPLDSHVYDEFYSYLEQVGMPIIMHVADPEDSWSMETASESAKKLGRVYCGDFPSKRQLTDEVFGILKKHPMLKLGLAHMGFMSYDVKEAERFFAYENTYLDVTPGGEQILNIISNWGEWKKFFERYQDRILYGTDFYAFPKVDDLWKVSVTRRPNLIRQAFETDEEHLYFKDKFRGVKLDKKMRDKIYRDNLINLLGEPKKIDKQYAKDEIKRLMNELPSGDSYYTNDGVIDMTMPENRKTVIERYIADLQYMLKNFD